MFVAAVAPAAAESGWAHRIERGELNLPDLLATHQPSLTAAEVDRLAHAQARRDSARPRALEKASASAAELLDAEVVVIPLVLHFMTSDADPKRARAAAETMVEYANELLAGAQDRLLGAHSRSAPAASPRPETGFRVELAAIAFERDVSIYGGFARCSYDTMHWDEMCATGAKYGWDPAVYVNAYVCGEITDAAGFASGPMAAQQHCVNVYLNAGMFNEHAASYNSVTGTVLAHELGHTFGLPHTFEGGCTEPKVFVEDTPASNPAQHASSCMEQDQIDSCPGMPGLDDLRNSARARALTSRRAPRGG